jgi:hypothetical protein
MILRFVGKQSGRGHTVKRSIIIAWGLIWAGHQFLSCSLPEDVAPAQWKMHVEIPVVDRSVSVRDLVAIDSVSGYKIDWGDSATIGDTVAVTRTDSMAYAFVQPLGTTGATVFARTLGPCGIRNLPPVELFASLRDDFTGDCPLNSPSPSSVTLSMPERRCELYGIQSLTFDETSAPLSVTVTNGSDRADLEKIDIALESEGIAAGAVHIASLPARMSVVVPVQVAGKSLKSPLSLRVGVTLCQGSVVRWNDRLKLSFSLNGMMLSQAVIKDYFLDYSGQLSGDLPVADSFRLDKIETGRTFLDCEIGNPAALRMEMRCAIGNQGQRGCDEGAGEETIVDTLFRLPDKTVCSQILPLGAMTLLPSWNPDSSKSYVGCRLNVRSLPDGRMLRFNKNDRLTLTIKPFRFPLISAQGRLYKRIEQANILPIKAGLAASAGVANSLRNALYFQSARLRFDFIPRLSRGNTIDSLLVNVTMKDSRGGDSAMLVQKLTGIEPASRHCAVMDFTGVFNRWPDTVLFKTRVILPRGTGISLFNPNSGGSVASSFLAFNPVLTWAVSVPLCWKVVDTLRIDLGKNEIAIENEQLKWIRKLRNTRVKILVDVENQTNLNAEIIALAAAAAHKEELMSFPDSLIGTGGFERNRFGHVFPIFDQGGLRLSPRGGRSHVSVTLDDRGVDAFVSQNSGIIRWFVVAPSKNSGALLSGDYFSLKATGMIEGVGNTDTLRTFE